MSESEKSWATDEDETFEEMHGSDIEGMIRQQAAEGTFLDIILATFQVPQGTELFSEQERKEFHEWVEADLGTAEGSFTIGGYNGKSLQEYCLQPIAPVYDLPKLIVGWSGQWFDKGGIGSAMSDFIKSGFNVTHEGKHPSKWAFFKDPVRQMKAENNWTRLMNSLADPEPNQLMTEKMPQPTATSSTVYTFPRWKDCKSIDELLCYMTVTAMSGGQLSEKVADTSNISPRHRGRNFSVISEARAPELSPGPQRLLHELVEAEDDVKKFFTALHPGAKQIIEGLDEQELLKHVELTLNNELYRWRIPTLSGDISYAHLIGLKEPVVMDPALPKTLCGASVHTALTSFMAEFLRSKYSGGWNKTMPQDIVDFIGKGRSDNPGTIQADYKLFKQLVDELADQGRDTARPIYSIFNPHQPDTLCGSAFDVLTRTLGRLATGSMQVKESF